MDEIYVVDGQQYAVGPSNLDSFLNQFPDATKRSTSGNQSPTNQSAFVEPGTALNMGFNLGSTLSESQEDDTFIDTNIVVFVIVHELAHIMTKEVGHTKTFWKNMKYLLEQCEIAKVYHPDNYNENPVPYCGMKITTTPYDFKK